MSLNKIAVINLGLGNIGSVINSLQKLNFKPGIIFSGQELESFNPSHIIMPGVGAVSEAMHKLKNFNFIDKLETLVFEKNCFFCGICLGMQVLAKSSEEFGNTQCLGWIDGKVSIMKTKGLSLPHMGWNTMHVKNKDSIFYDLNDKDMYFAHSYSMNCDKIYIAATSNYGSSFVSGVQYKNIFGIQSQPEKSAFLGSIFFTNFLNLR